MTTFYKKFFYTLDGTLLQHLYYMSIVNNEIEFQTFRLLGKNHLCLHDSYQWDKFKFNWRHLCRASHTYTFNNLPHNLMKDIIRWGFINVILLKFTTIIINAYHEASHQKQQSTQTWDFSCRTKIFWSWSWIMFTSLACSCWMLNVSAATSSSGCGWMFVPAKMKDVIFEWTWDMSAETSLWFRRARRVENNCLIFWRLAWCLQNMTIYLSNQMLMSWQNTS